VVVAWFVQDAELKWGKYGVQTQGKKTIKKPLGPLCGRCDETRMWGWELLSPTEVCEKVKANEENFAAEFKQATRLREAINHQIAREVESLRAVEKSGSTLENRVYFLSNAEFSRDFLELKLKDLEFTQTKLRQNHRGVPEQGVSFAFDANWPKYRVLVQYGTCEVEFAQYKVHANQVVREGQAYDLRKQHRESTAVYREAPVPKHNGKPMTISDMQKLAQTLEDDKLKEKKKIEQDAADEDKKNGEGTGDKGGSDCDSDGSGSSSDDGDSILEIDDDKFKDEEQAAVPVKKGRGKGRGKGRVAKGKASPGARSAGMQQTLTGAFGQKESSSMDVDDSHDPGTGSTDVSRKVLAPGSREKLEASCDFYMEKCTVLDVVNERTTVKADLYQARRQEKAMTAFGDLMGKKVLLTQRLVTRLIIAS
jgi:hypothetical protein